MKKGDIVYLTWDDIVAHLGTHEKTKPLVAYSVGKVEKITERYVRLVSGWYESPVFTERDTIAIPRGAITHVEVLK